MAIVPDTMKAEESLPSGESVTICQQHGEDLWKLAFEKAGFDEHQRGVLLGESSGASWSPSVLVERVSDSTIARFRDCKSSKWFSGPRDHTAAVSAQAKTVFTAILALKNFVDAGMKFDITGMIASFSALVEEPLTTLKQDIAELDGSAKEWLDPIAHQFRMQESQRLESGVAELLSQASHATEKFEIMYENLRTADEDRIRDWLCEDRFSHTGRHIQIQNDLRQYKDKLKPGQWLLNSDEFEKWVYYPQQLLWLQGNSGSGKSYLCSIVVEHLRATYDMDLRKIVAFWFFDSLVADTDNLERMLRSLINQLMPGPELIPAFVAAFRKNHHNTQSLPTLEKLITLLLQVVCNLKRDIFLVIDGLDQCGHTESVSLKLKGLLPVIDINKNNGQDLDDFMLFKLSKDIWPKVTSSATKFEVMRALRSDTMKSFLWTEAQIRFLSEFRTDSSIRKALDKVPDTLEALYCKALGVIKEEERDLARSMLHLLCLMRTRIKRDALADYAGLARPADIPAICGNNLVDVNEDGFVQLIQPALQQVLESDNIRQNCSLQSFHLLHDDAHAKITERCLDYISRCTEGPFCHYACEFWHIHFKESGALKDPDNPVFDLVLRFLLSENNAALRFWRKQYVGPKERYQRQKGEGLKGEIPLLHYCPEPGLVSPIYIALELEMPVLARSLMKINGNVSQAYGRLGTALQVAAHRGYGDIVGQLLQLGADPNATPNGPLGTALFAACISGNRDIVRILIQQGPTKCTLDNQYRDVGTALQYASFRGYKGIVDDLLAAGADVLVTGGVLGDALQAAAVGRHISIVKTLLANGAHSTRLHGLFGNALLAACILGDEKTRDLLIADREKRNNAGRLWESAIDRAYHLDEYWKKPYWMDSLLQEGPNCPQIVWGVLLSQQKRAAGIIHYATPKVVSGVMRQHVQKVPRLLHEELHLEVQATFKTDLNGSLLEEPDMDGCASPFFAAKHFFRSAVLALLDKLDKSERHNSLIWACLTKLLATRRRTAAYEDYVLNSHDDMAVYQLQMSLVDLFFNLVHALFVVGYPIFPRRITHAFRVEYNRDLALGKVPSQQELLQIVEKCEEATHTEASRYLLAKQATSINEMQREQRALVSKMEVMANKINKLSSIVRPTEVEDANGNIQQEAQAEQEVLAEQEVQAEQKIAHPNKWLDNDWF
ncbi:hypothetical protein N0V83_010899 [Neocucurbitaria cava]|uniref:Nephrocystin 3-like N-terminal domain-containing protein n=1 Tax=Neocucurbitaria cava TaxID=798079 RepID=A0A9W8XXF1_9PLEO|nr:hypothetical protein N0V83_010899 [Neocucurbitaria cava]